MDELDHWQWQKLLENIQSDKQNYKHFMSYNKDRDNHQRMSSAETSHLWDIWSKCNYYYKDNDKEITIENLKTLPS